MNAPNPPNAPGSDIFEKNMNGIDLRTKQDHLFNVEIPKQDQSFHTTQKPRGKFSSSGLWRKKRDISSSKMHFQR